MNRVIAPGRLAAALPVLLSLSACGLFSGDGATRIAFRLESEGAQFRASGAATHGFSYLPKGGYDDCAEAYDVQFSAKSALVVWCKDAGGNTTSSHTTTYHLNFVKVPKTWIVKKRPGERMWIDLAREGGNVVISDVR